LKAGAGDEDRTRNFQLGIKFPLLYFHNLQNRSGKINTHAPYTMHALPDLHVAGGRFGTVSVPVNEQAKDQFHMRKRGSLKIRSDLKLV